MLFSGQFNVEAGNNRGLKNLSLPVGLVGPVFFFWFFLRCGKGKIVLSVFSTPDLLCRLQKGSLTRWWWGVVKESVQEYTANIHDSEKLIQEIN